MISLPLGLAVCGPVFHVRLTLTKDVRGKAQNTTYDMI